MTPDQMLPDATGAQRLPTLYGCAIGRALATVRVRSGIPVCTLATLLDRAPADLLDLEDGRAAVSVALLQRWCDRLGVSASSVLAWAARAAAPDLRGWVIDLRAAAELPTLTNQPHIRKLARWARQLRDEDSHRPFLTVPEPEIRALATRWSIPVGALVDVLADLTPLALVPWRESEHDRAQSGAVQAWNARPRRHHNDPAPMSDADEHPGREDVGRVDTRAEIHFPLADRVGLLLRRERLAHQRGLASLARALHVSPSHICRVELARTDVKLSFLARWCIELGVGFSDLLRRAEDYPLAESAPSAGAPDGAAGLVLPAWTVPLYRISAGSTRPAPTGVRCAHPDVQTQAERRAGRPADVTRCVTCGQPVPIRTARVAAGTPARCPLPPDVTVVDEGVIAR